MREINVAQITEVIARLCIEANTHLPEDVKGTSFLFLSHPVHCCCTFVCFTNFMNFSCIE